VPVEANDIALPFGHITGAGVDAGAVALAVGIIMAPEGKGAM